MGTTRDSRGRSAKRGATWDRATTERALMDAAIRLLRRDGVLAGLSLQEVADEAGVTRSLIHHYFGTRRALLRAALEAHKNDGAETVREQATLAPRSRSAWSFRVHASELAFPRLVMLLALDGDDELEPFPFADENLELLEREQNEGIWEEDADLLAIWLIFNTFAYGYNVLRESTAREFGLAPATLDRRLRKSLSRLFASVLVDDGARPS